MAGTALLSVEREQATIEAIERGHQQLRSGQSFSQEEVFADVFAIIDGEREKH